ncbi:MAG: urease accessory protein UreD [Pseudomonadota bacterium]|nr:urease accessory protein UreD [Pseudomonadota bacterium]
MTRNQHRGPLQVQKALYPEGPEVCHIAVLHPPGGIAAGDRLCVRASLEDGSQALLTTPGATKWYRSEGSWATQQVNFSLGEDACVEWLPRENIFFDGAKVSMELDVDLAGHAQYVGWDIVSFGRRASGETWRRGQLHMHTHIRCADRVLWSEVANVDAQSGFADSPVGLAGFTVCGTFVFAGSKVTAALLAGCRGVQRPVADSRVGVTQVPRVLIARYLGDSSEDAFQWFASLWGILRQAALGKAAHSPRVWAC